MKWKLKPQDATTPDPNDQSFSWISLSEHIIMVIKKDKYYPYALVEFIQKNKYIGLICLGKRRV